MQSEKDPTTFGLLNVSTNSRWIRIDHVHANVRGHLFAAKK